MEKQKYNELSEQVLSVLKKDGSDAALAYLGDCIKKNPNFLEAYTVRGELYTEMGNFHDALNDFEEVIKIDPKEPEAYFLRGLLYVKSGGDINKALNDFNKTIELDANHAGAYTNRANMYIKKEEFQKAISDCTKAIELSPDSMEPYYNRGLAYANIEEVGKALEDYSMVINLTPENAEAFAKRGLLHSQLGNVQEAIRDYNKFLELDPDNTKATLVQNALRELRNGKTSSTSTNGSGGSCYIATYIYGSYDCPEVLILRRYRDSHLSKSWYGRWFIQIYYMIGPKIVELFGDKKWFNGLWEPVLNKLVYQLRKSGIDISSCSDSDISKAK